MKIEVTVKGSAAVVKRAVSDQKKIWKKLGYSFVSLCVSDRRGTIKDGTTDDDAVKQSMLFIKRDGGKIKQIRHKRMSKKH